MSRVERDGEPPAEQGDADVGSRERLPDNGGSDHSVVDELVSRDGLSDHGRLDRRLPEYVASGVVGRYPAYLCGLIVHSHQNSAGRPKKYAALALPDGRILAARCARNWPAWASPTTDDPTCDWFPHDEPDPDELDETGRAWHQQCAGWAGFAPTGVDARSVALDLLTTAVDHGGFIARQLRSFHARGGTDDLWDGDIVHDVVASSWAAIAAVEGVWFDPVALASLDNIPDWLRRELQIPPPPPDDPILGAARHHVATCTHPDVVGLYEEAMAIATISPRAAIAVLHTTAERILDHLDLDRPLTGRTFSGRIDDLERYWKDNPAPPPATGDHRPVTSRETARRSTVLAALHTMRDQGNLIHAAAPVDNDNLNRCVLALRELIDILTGQHRLHRPGPHEFQDRSQRAP